MDRHLRVAEFLAHFLDSQFNIAGFRFGAAAVIELIPGLGDFVATFLSLYIVWIAVQMNVPTPALARMIVNVFLRFIAGLIPFFGDIAYLFYQANLKNLEILKQYAGQRPTHVRLAS